jgi:hypothetical protein
MRTAAQIEASRNNAAHSTGPRTEEGKAASSRNALKAGASSRVAVLPWEDQAQYDALVADTVERYRPQGEREHVLAQLVATTMWRYRRLLNIEAEFMSAVDDGGSNPHAALAALFADAEGSGKLRLMLRYLANASREYRAALAELRRVQSERERFAADPFSCEITARQPLSEVAPAAMDHSEPSQAPAPESTGLSRAERRALEKARRKAEKRARQADWAATKAGFVSHCAQNAPEATAA